ncbi:MAG TPA: hypothetical protein VLY46_06600 [Usitatibacter sp.]|nr:hypothetical protein [Usitatibacter sp.]
MRPLAAPLALLAATLLVAAAHAATPSISAGGWHSLALATDGTARAWGDDTAGALGSARALASTQPVPVTGISDVVAIATGDSHTVALKRDGTVWAWGGNGDGELGDGTTTGRSTPVQVAGLANVVEIAAGSVHTVARKSDGTVWTWGANNAGQLGDDSNGRSAPGQVPGIGDAVAIAAGGQQTFVVRSDGTVWAWGENDLGQLGNGTVAPAYTGTSTPTQVVGLTGVVQVAAGFGHTLARRSDGTVWAWGDNSDGELGDGTTNSRPVPSQVPGLSAVISIAAGSYSLAIQSDGSVWAWGSNGYDQIADGTYVDVLAPEKLALPAIASAAVGFIHSSAVASDGHVWSWGHNDHGELGDGTTQQREAPVLLAGIDDATAISTGSAHTVALKRDGTVWAWGDDGSGQLGDGVRVFVSTPTIPGGASGWIAVAGGGRHSIALESDGTVVAAGNNDYGQLGDGTVASRATFAPVQGLSGVTAISAGFYHSLALKGDGTVWAWGLGYNGRLGNGGDSSQGPVPVQVSGLAGVTQVSAGGGHSLALEKDGSVWAWGENGYGQLGDGTTATRFVPVRVAGLSDVVEVAAGADHSLARARDGRIWAWGGDYEGQLGDGGFTDRSTPAVVDGLAGIASIAAGNTVSAAIDPDGRVWMWGANYFGQLGDGTFEDHFAPVRVPGIDGVARISIGETHTLALKADGAVLAWGGNDFGQLGDGTLAGRGSPVVSVRENGAGSIAGGDWFLDLDPATPTSISGDLLPVFLAVATNTAGQVAADIQYRQQDAGTSGSVFVFALAPATLVKDARGKAQRIANARGATADDPVPCVLAQLDPSGTLQAASASSLQPYLSGVLSAAGQSVSILNSAAGPQVAGATFFVGYGADASSMISSGTNRSVLSVPGTVQCTPQPPQTGWWWNPLEDGRGFSIEKHGNNLFFASFLYDASGRSTWVVSSGPASLDGAYYSGDLLSAHGGQTLGGAYPGFPAVDRLGSVALAFTDASHGTMVWPGGTVPIERFNIIPNGLTLAAAPNQPENGWWWNPDESGRGFFLEWQGGTLDVAGYMYDDAGNPVWYISVDAMKGADGLTFSNAWLSYGGGQTLTGAWQQNHQVSNDVAPLTIQFTAPDAAIMTLPNGRTTALTRQRF